MTIPNILLDFHITNFFAISALANFVLIFLLGLYVYFINENNKANRAYSYLCFAISFWALNYYFWQIAVDAPTATFFCHLLMVGSSFIPTTFFHFTLKILNIKEQKKHLLYIAYAFSVFFAILSAFTPYIVSGVGAKFIFPFWPLP